jgi:DNA-binding MarR family transcriptional regulator
MQTYQLYQLGRTLIDAARRAQGATDHGMTASEFLVLRDLFLNGQSSVGEIVSRTDLAQSRVSFCVNSLVKRNWVQTSSDPADGRKTLAQVTDRVKAEGMRRRAIGAEDALAPLLSSCSAKERKTVTQALARLYELSVDAADETLKPKHLRPSRTASDAAQASSDGRDSGERRSPAKRAGATR